MSRLLYSFITILGFFHVCRVIVYQNFIHFLLCLSLFSERSMCWSAFCSLSVTVSVFPFFFFPLLPSVHSILVVSPNLLLLRPTCQDHRDQFSTTRQHLSSCCIRHGSEHPLSSCLLLPWTEGAVCTGVCEYVCALCLCCNFWKMPPNEKQLSSWFTGWQQREPGHSSGSESSEGPQVPERCPQNKLLGEGWLWVQRWRRGWRFCGIWAGEKKNPFYFWYVFWTCGSAKKQKYQLFCL